MPYFLTFYNIQRTRICAQADAKFITQALRSFLKLPAEEQEAGEGIIVVKALAPLHGPVVRSTVTELVREYREVRNASD
jgi:flavorubredoxin